jgi:hypothetical protein
MGIVAGRMRRRRHVASRGTLAERIAGRFGLRRLSVPPLAAVLLRRQRPPTAVTILNVTAGITLHRHCSSRIELTATPESGVPPVRLSKLSRGTTPDGAPSERKSTAIERIAAREYRREAFITDRRSIVTRHLPQQVTNDVQPIWHIRQPIELVLRRNDSAPAAAGARVGRAPAETQQIRGADRAAEGSVRHAASAAATIPLSPSELARLTDDVVRAIDRRFTAHRERRGVI